ncbi:MAG: DNA mismatch repair protein MutT [Planctomycetaceae bacterium]|nr:DNA mismatch repair protein MutT [Planctomycetaceae bacterium]
MSQIRSCGFLIVRGKPVSNFLLMRHTDRWDLPKGHVDSGESDLQCALRELEEETAITIDDIEIDDRFRFTTQYPVVKKKNGKVRQKTLVIFLAYLVRDVHIKVTEHPNYQWFDWLPPQQIQIETIDPLLAELQVHLASVPEA